MMQVALSIDGCKVIGYWSSFAECIRYVDSLPVKGHVILMQIVGEEYFHCFKGSDFE